MERVEGDGLDEYILTEASPTPSPFRFGGLGGGGLWDDVEDTSKYGSKRKHEELNDELVALIKDAGLENMASEVGTLEGGQIAALQGCNRETNLGKSRSSFSSADVSPLKMTASAIFSPNPRGMVPPLDSPLTLKGALGSPTAPISMTASAIFSPNPGRGGVLGSHLHESPSTAMKATDLRQAAGPDTPPEMKPKKKTRKSLPPSNRDIPPPEPVPPPPAGGRMRRSSTYGTELSADTEITGITTTTTTTSAAAASTTATRKKKGDPKPSKGLRHFSVKVCRKVEEKGSTSYNEVADELVKELAMEREFGTGKETHYDDKNIRRRVYDALNVLMAIDIISKDRKEIKWKGLPESVAHSSIPMLQRKKNQRERSLEEKKAQLAELLVQQIAFRNLARRNRSTAAARASSGIAGGFDGDGEQDPEDVPNSKLYTPFIVVSSRNDTLIQCEMAENREDVFFNFSNQFQIADDTEILKRMGLHKCRKQDLPVLLARELIPQVPNDVLIDDEENGSVSSAPSSPASSCSDESPSS